MQRGEEEYGRKGMWFSFLLVVIDFFRFSFLFFSSLLFSFPLFSTLLWGRPESTTSDIDSTETVIVTQTLRVFYFFLHLQYLHDIDLSRVR